MNDAGFVKKEDMKQLEALLNVLLRDEALLESLSLVERQHLEGSCVIVQSLLKDQICQRMRLLSTERPELDE